jgi:hypothetical protein
LDCNGQKFGLDCLEKKGKDDVDKQQQHERRPAIRKVVQKVDSRKHQWPSSTGSHTTWNMKQTKKEKPTESEGECDAFRTTS